MCHDLKAFVKGPVTLAVDAFPIPVGPLQYPFGVVIILAGTVDLQLYAEKPGALAKEYRCGLVGIGMDRRLVQGGKAAVAQRQQVVIAVLVIGIVQGKQLSAMGAVGVVPVIAATAQRRVAVTIVVIIPEPCAAVVTEDGFLVQTVRTEILVLKDSHFGKGICFPTDLAHKGLFSHLLVLLVHDKIDGRTQRCGCCGQNDAQKLLPNVKLGHPATQTCRRSWSTMVTMTLRMTDKSTFIMMIFTPFRKIEKSRRA
jgi:hypothetical protein